jgi:N-acetyl-gamma-glutamyl-phosphate reductase
MQDNSKIKVGIFGASGYTGFETAKIINKHPAAELVFATSEASAGKTLGHIYPTTWNFPLVAAVDAPLKEVDAVFCCLPHAASMPTVIAARQAGARVLDLSADFRLKDVDVYEKWYKVPHQSPELLKESVYGLTELYRSEVAETDLVAVPGCYPTNVLLPLIPLLRANLLDASAPIIADSKTGISGAGRKANVRTQFVEINEDLAPYNIGQKHRHIAEMSQIISELGGNGDKVIFSPHLLPISRGMLSTIYVSLTEDMSEDAVRDLFNQSYTDAPFVQILPAGQLASMAHTQRTNMCVISVTAVTPRQLILCSSIDNLGKGAAGQGVQNLNVMFGLEETEGLL